MPRPTGFLPAPRARHLARRLTLVAALAAPLGGCGLFHIWDTAHYRHGAMIEQDALQQLVPGTSTRADAISLLGSPTARATFDDNTWIYVTQIVVTRIGRLPGVTKQNVLVLKFDPAGTLRAIQRLDKQDGKQIAMAPGATPSPGSEASFMQQLLGNVGRFTPAGLPGSSALSGPTGGNSGTGSPVVGGH